MKDVSLSPDRTLSPFCPGIFFVGEQMIVYCATNKINGRRYVGQTVRAFAIRQRAHLGDAKRGVKNKFYNAIRKYGADAFEWSILYRGKSIEDLNAMEEYFIAAYESRTGGYNIKFGGGNRRCPISTRAKISAAMKGKKLPAETRAKMSEARKRENLSEETKKKQSEATKGEKNPNFGKKHSEETKKKMSAALKGKKLSAETKAKMSEGRKGDRNPRFDPKKYSFSHAEHGVVDSTRYDLIKKYGLGDSHIHSLTNGKRNSHKGWRLANAAG